MLDNSQLFLNSFSEIEEYLYRFTNITRHDSFGNLVNRASHTNSVIRQYKTDLLEIKDLRNAIVHERTDGHVIAEPHDDIVKLIRKIEGLLKDPPVVLPTFQGEVVTLQSKDSLLQAVKLMREKAYTQIPILDHKYTFIDLLTTNTVVRWLGSNTEKKLLHLLNIRIDGVLRYKENNNTCLFIPGTMNYLDVLALFDDYKNKSQKLEALIITPNGRPNENFLGIITNRDLPTIYYALENF